jgi:hypothetical protein
MLGITGTGRKRGEPCFIIVLPVVARRNFHA